VLTLVDHAAPSRLREAYLRLRGHDPGADVIVDVQRLAELPTGTTVMLAMTPSITADALDWLNLNRPIIADRRLNVVLWCEGEAAAVLARAAPDFFDWISALVDCPPAPAAFAVADVKAAIRARAPGIAWAGTGLEDTLGAVRPGRPIRRVAVASYQSMIDALASPEPGWLFLDGIDTEFHLRRLRWAMAETGRRVIVLRRAIDHSLPGWWTLHTEHAPISDAVHDVIAAGGTGGLAALTGLDPTAMASAIFLLRAGIDGARLEALISASSDPRVALQNVARPMGWTAAGELQPTAWKDDEIIQQPPSWISGARQVFGTEAVRRALDDDPIVQALRARPPANARWDEIGTTALDAGDFEVAIRWLTAAVRSLPDGPHARRRAILLSQRGRAYQLAGALVCARADLEQAHTAASVAADTVLAARTAAWLGEVLVLLGEPQRARAGLEPALQAIAQLEDRDALGVLETLAEAMICEHELAGARVYLQRALSIRQRIFTTEDHISIAQLLGLIGQILAMQGDMTEARGYLERSLEIRERLLGRDHPGIAPTLNALAQVQQATGDLLGARRLVYRALAIQTVTLDAGHPDSADTLVGLARVLAASGDLQEARSTLEAALAIQQKAFGHDGQLAGATTRRELAKVLAARGDLTGAIENLQQALAIQRRVFERDDHPDIVASERELERLQTLQRDVQRPD